ncbi:alpha/beta fold hydrolase [Bradyrhizobium ontarionense]|uniref:Alpha/beta fold hydrolase n=1 Tax=Bradyrhizobium ontarionense TaxID=2898149 RepID=A0ABY3RB75_9BRAD|nr:alpha/beta fold hydrolase [Bradyrhizobium sp. A19]UFZ04313.1 alpha/beta fold hydrolase [Bradyrhizobium sp. A19]
MASLRRRHQQNSPRHAGVVLLHGIAGRSLMLRPFEKSLQRAGFATLNIDYESRKKPLELLAEDIRAAVSDFAARLDGPVHFVTHSMGGLLAQVYIARHRPARLGRVVMLGTPNGGSELADRLQNVGLYRAYFGPAGLQLVTTKDVTLASLPAADYEIGVIAGNRFLDPICALFLLPWPNDGRVSVESCKLAEMADYTTVKASHMGLLMHPTSFRQTIAFLRNGQFDPARPPLHSVFSDIGRRAAS